jgi:Transposase DDE domain group 1
MFTDLYSLLPYGSALLLWVEECGRGRSRGKKSLRFPGAQMLARLKRLGKQLRHAWPDTLLLLRGKSHFAYPEVMQWVQAQPGLISVTGLTSNAILLVSMPPMTNLTSQAMAVQYRGSHEASTSPRRPVPVPLP